MKKESIRALGQIKNLMEQQNQYKRYMRVQEATRNYQLDRRIICEIAKECHRAESTGGNGKGCGNRSACINQEDGRQGHAIHHAVQVEQERCGAGT